MGKIASPLVASVLILVALAIVPQAQACDRCGFKLDCSKPDCDLVLACNATNFPTRGFSECWVNSFDCYTGGELCRWTWAPSQEHDFLAMLAGQSRSSMTSEQQCSADFKL